MRAIKDNFVTLNKEQRETVNAMLKKYRTGIMLAVKGGKTELLRDHWQYINVQDAKRVLVFKRSSVKDGLYYLTDAL